MSSESENVVSTVLNELIDETLGSEDVITDECLQDLLQMCIDTNDVAAIHRLMFVLTPLNGLPLPLSNTTPSSDLNELIDDIQNEKISITDHNVRLLIGEAIRSCNFKLLYDLRGLDLMLPVGYRDGIVHDAIQVNNRELLEWFRDCGLTISSNETIDIIEAATRRNDDYILEWVKVCGFSE